MPNIAKKQLEHYQRLHSDRNNGRILTLDGIRFICESYKDDPKAIGMHMLETLVRIQSKEC